MGIEPEVGETAFGGIRGEKFSTEAAVAMLQNIIIRGREREHCRYNIFMRHIITTTLT